MIDKAAIFTTILHKNALRRESGLPEWPVRATVERDWQSASWREYVQLNGARIRAQVLAKHRLRHGPEWPASSGGRMAFSLLVSKALGDGFRDQCSG